jgi:hypothetical protein
MTSVREATIFFELFYERALVPEMEKRIDYARWMYALFGGK